MHCDQQVSNMRKNFHAAGALALAVSGLLLGCLDSEESPTESASASASGIPVVEGIQASLDTAAGVVKLTWKPSKYPKLKEYVVYRVQKAGDAPDIAPSIGETRDTLFIDSVRKDFGIGDFHMEYRVRVRNAAGQVGMSPGPLTVHIVPVRVVRTAITVRLGVPGAMVSIGDTLRVIVEYDNPTRKVTRLECRFDGPDSASAVRTLSRRTGKDTLLLVSTMPHAGRIRVLIKDDAGGESYASVPLEVSLDPPVANAGRDTIVKVGHPLRLHGTGSDRFGRIVKWEWDIGNRGKFVESADGDFVFSADTIGFSRAPLRCVLRVTDDDGLSGTDTSSVKVDAIEPLNMIQEGGVFPDQPSGLHAVSGKIYVVEPGIPVKIYDIAGKSWSNGGFSTFPGSYLGSQDCAGTFYAMSHQYERFPKLWKYDVEGNAWMALQEVPVKAQTGEFMAVGRKLYFITCQYSSAARVVQSMWEYDTDGQGGWVERPVEFPSEYGPNAEYGLEWTRSLGGKLYLGWTIGAAANGILEFDPQIGSWSAKRSPDRGYKAESPSSFSAASKPGFPSLAVFDNNKVMYGYDPTGDQWFQGDPVPELGGPNTFKDGTFLWAWADDEEIYGILDGKWVMRFRYATGRWELLQDLYPELNMWEPDLKAVRIGREFYFLYEKSSWLHFTRYVLPAE